MKNNRGITIVTLIIMIIVIVLIASITIYSGLGTLDSARLKNAKDTTKAIYLALIANEDIIPSGFDDGKMISDYDEINDRVLSDTDFKLLGLDYDSDDCAVMFDKYLSGDNMIVYNFTYKNDMNKTYDNLVYTSYKERANKTNGKIEFDSIAGVNRPIISDESMIPIGYDSGEVKNIYVDRWYNYERNVSHLATVNCNGKTFVWIPRFAYKIQDFYLGKSYQNVPNTSIDIAFLREDTDYMANNEVLPVGYEVHPAFESGAAGFWISVESISNINSISNAIDEARNFDASNDCHLMKNSEYAAVVYLSRYLNNSQVIFDEKEYVAAILDDGLENFDIYSTDYDDLNNIRTIVGHALLDTPWNLKEEPILPDADLKYLLRDVANGGEFYYEASDGVEDAVYRVAISK